MNPADINVTPDWVNETVWYQIFPDRFCRGADTKEEAGVTKWRTGTVTNEERFGGNLNGIREKIPYLEGLGITGIYLNPIMKAESNHKYDTTDYTVIDPHFGTEEEFRSGRRGTSAWDSDHGGCCVQSLWKKVCTMAGCSGEKRKICVCRLVYDP